MNLKPLASIILTATLTSQLAACGTVFYPERRGQISGEIDSGVAILNGIGLLFYIIPGLIAFAVDFATGAIYLPDARYSLAPERLNQAVDEHGQVDAQKLQAILYQDLGIELPLEQAQRLSAPSTQQLALLGLPPRA
ncbi:polyribonucleotide nucleotidyltransferase [Halopseudomonas phragmitis]|uniref:Polyribonucleotide nucleotidyltransferase n=2 Tax=Pseudomonadaceae TaxID=135621 RepID=A0A1V0B4S4_9GAMM|nr:MULTISPECIES: polyribonucleotide nucleotidyltransferase [Pseudomonadaceae]AQZ94938.1 polyribonucleotide nucleotidyltransferase [Halopseudomonas phragmitis]RHW23096.1 polyribonucleotide nucleotidyltransferase [Pseudomonas jilinensis]